MMHDSVADRLSLFSLQRGQQVEAVLSGVVGKLHAHNLSRRPHQVRETAQLIANRSGGNFSGPARQKRDTMSGVPDIGFFAFPTGVGAMGEALLVFRFPVRSVVAGEDDERIAGNAGFVDGAQHLPQRVVHLGYEIAVNAGFGFALKFRSGDPWSVRRGEREIEEEWLRRFRRAVGDQLHGAAGERREYGLDLEMRRDAAAAPEDTAR